MTNDYHQYLPNVQFILTMTTLTIEGSLGLYQLLVQLSGIIV